MKATVTWKSKMAFSGKSDSQIEVPLDTSIEYGGENSGVRPMELIAIGLAGCSGMDVISILQKKRQEVTGLNISVQADRSSEHPRVFTKMTIEYVVSGKNIDPSAVNRAVDLSLEKYCSVHAMLAKSVPIEHSIVIHNVET